MEEKIIRLGKKVNIYKYIFVQQNHVFKLTACTRVGGLPSALVAREKGKAG